jgi:hypothetical protein
MVVSRWDALCCLLVLYVALTLPVEVAFHGSSDRFDVWTAIGICIDILFVVDMYINFRTGVPALNERNSTRRLIIRPC